MESKDYKVNRDDVFVGILSATQKDKIIYDKNGRITQVTFFEQGEKIAYQVLTSDGQVSKICQIEKGKEICK